MNNYQVAIFDFDGTLCASKETTVDCIKATFNSFKHSIPAEDNIQTVLENGLDIMDCLKMLNPDLMAVDTQKIDSWLERYYTLSQDTTCPLFEHALKVLQDLHSSKVDIVIVSNNTEKNIAHILSENNATHLVDKIIGFQENTATKPDPNIFLQQIYPCYNHPMTEFIVIGDTTTDIQFAQNSGIDSCWADYGYGNEENCFSLGPTYKISAIEEVLPILLGSTSRLSR